MTERVTIETRFFVDVSDYEIHDDSPVKGSHQREGKGQQKIGPFDTREEAESALEAEKSRLLAYDYWREDVLPADLFAITLWNDWQKHHRDLRITSTATELSREIVTSVGVAS